MKRTDVTKDDLTAWAARLGYDPGDVYEIVLHPSQILVRTYRKQNGHTYLCECGDIASRTDVLALALASEEDE